MVRLRRQTINIDQYFKQLFTKYRTIQRGRNEPSNANVGQNLGDQLNINHGKIKKQRPAKVMKREFNHKMFTVKGKDDTPIK